MDTQLLLELYKKQSKIILGYLIKNGCTKEEAEDIVQNSFIKANLTNRLMLSSC